MDQRLRGVSLTSGRSAGRDPAHEKEGIRAHARIPSSLFGSESAGGGEEKAPMPGVHADLRGIGAHHKRRRPVLRPVFIRFIRFRGTGLLHLDKSLAGHLLGLGKSHELEHRRSHVGQDAVVHRLHAVRHHNDGHRVERVRRVGRTVGVDGVVGVALAASTTFSTQPSTALTALTIAS